MSEHRNIRGISRYWKKGEDDRELLAVNVGMDPEDKTSRELLDMFLSGLMNTVKSRRRTKFVGFGVFEWKPWRNRIPTGEFVDVWRLTFKPGRYVDGRYSGE